MDVFWAAVHNNFYLYGLPIDSRAHACVQTLSPFVNPDKITPRASLFLARVGTHISASDLACAGARAEIGSFLQTRLAKHGRGRG